VIARGTLASAPTDFFVIRDDERRRLCTPRPSLVAVCARRRAPEWRILPGLASSARRHGL
jgi:hypothetical protein